MLLLVPCLLLAQDNSSSSTQSGAAGAPMLDELKIIAGSERPPRTGEVVDEEHTGSHSRIKRARLAQPGAQLADLLSSTSGVQQKQSGGFGTFSSITMRAASTAQTAVYLDGILLNNGGESVIDLSTLEILNLESVDIYKGSTPLQLGQASMGGALNLNTVRAQDNPGTRLRQGFGSFSYSSVLAANQAAFGKWDWTASLSRQQSDNDFPFTDNNATPLNPLDDSHQRRRNNRAERTSVLLKTGHQSTARQRTDLLVQFADRNLGIPTSRNSPGNRANYETQKTQVQLSRIIDQWSGWNSRHSVYWHGSDSVYDDTESQVGLAAQYIDTQVRTLGASTYWERFLTVGTWGLSIDVRDESLDLDDELNAGENFTADRQLLNANSHLAVLDSGERWMMTPALRWQYSRHQGTSTATGALLSLPEQNASEIGVQLGLAYFMTPALTINANAGNYYREPSFTELYGSIGLINGNPELDPENGINADVSLSYRADTLQLDLALFHNRHDNLILNSFNARGIGRPDNTGKAETTGLELALNWTPVPNWQLSASATFQDPRNRDPFKGYQNRILPGESRRAGFVRLAHTSADIVYWYEWQSTGTRYYDSANLLPATESSLHSLGIDFENPRWSLGARLQNIGDDNIEDFNGFPKPGRSFFITLTQNF